MVFAIFGAKPNTIKEQQAAWQAAKKLAGGNTMMTNNMATYIPTLAVIIGGGTFVMFYQLRNLYFGINKYVLKDDE